MLPETRGLLLAPGDRVLLCSDGVWKPLSAEALSTRLQADEPPERLCQHLVAAANEASGDDNSTAPVVTCQLLQSVATEQRASRRARTSSLRS